MESLQNHDVYGPELARRIEAQGRYTISVANRWMLGWPQRVQALVTAQLYWACLMAQVSDEKDILADEPNLRHLSEREILQLRGLQASPPVMDGITQ